MIRKFQILFWLLAMCKLGIAQITTTPDIPIDSKAVTITFDSSKDSRLGYFTGDLYAHTGVYISGTTGWKHVIGSWGDNTGQPKLTNKGNGIYELVITPTIKTYYSTTSSEQITSMNFVFRSADGSKQTNDLFVTVSTEDLHVTITSPSSDINVYQKSQSFQFTASSTVAATLKLFQNNQEIASQTETTSLSKSVSISTAANYWLKATATQNNVVQKIRFMFVSVNR